MPNYYMLVATYDNGKTDIMMYSSTKDFFDNLMDIIGSCDYTCNCGRYTYNLSTCSNKHLMRAKVMDEYGDLNQDYYEPNEDPHLMECDVSDVEYNIDDNIITIDIDDLYIRWDNNMYFCDCKDNIEADGINFKNIIMDMYAGYCYINRAYGKYMKVSYRYGSSIKDMFIYKH